MFGFSACSPTVLTDEIRRNKIVMFSKTTCSYCVKAKRLMEANLLDYSTVELNKIDDPNNCLKRTLVETTNSTTVPQIFVCEKFIGGIVNLTLKNV